MAMLRLCYGIGEADQAEQEAAAKENWQPATKENRRAMFGKMGMKSAPRG